MSEHVVIVGGGIGGLTAALALGRAGHPVTLLEQDTFQPVDDAEAAFAAPRKGAPQVHQTHGFLARIVVLLRERFPDVFEDLLAAGCTTLPTTSNLGEPQPGDEDLRVLIVRRTTFEWVLRRAAFAQSGVDVRTGAHVVGLTAEGGTVTGVRLDDGTTVAADAVIASTGRRGPVREWLSAVGVEIEEDVKESGLMYVSRWYRLPPDFEVQLDPKLGGDLGFVKYLGVPGDAGTLSVTLAIRTDDGELRSMLADPDRFDEACRRLPGPNQFFAAGPLEPMGGVRLMGGLLNRLRRFTDANGDPLAPGFHVVGDAHTCTNPLYGRGCSLAAVMAVLLADAFAEHPGDPIARGRAYEAACAREVEPWFHASVEMDKMGADPAGIGGSEAEPNPMTPVFVAAATDPIIGRTLTRFWNLLATPADLMTDPAFTARCVEVMAEPEKYPLPPREGPTRDELLASLEEVPACAS